MINRFNFNNNSTLTEQPKDIDFEVMGLDNFTSDFLNWVLQNRDNLEFIKEKKVLELQSASSVLYFNDLKIIERIDKTSVERRTP